MNIVVIIQARMGSTRLPGKILADISGKPMLLHVIDRIKTSKLANNIVVATSTDERDDPVEKLCEQNNISLYRGKEDDVLDRYYQAGKQYNADIIVRITGDCPLIDADVTDKVISMYLDNRKEYDGASNVVERTYPRGLDSEVFCFRALEKIWEKTREKRFREHVTLYFYESDDYKILSVKNQSDLSRFRWTVDEESDLELVREIYGRLYEENRIFKMKDILRILEEEPSLSGINREVRQKEVNP